MKEKKEIDIKYQSVIDMINKQGIIYYTINIEPDFVCFLRKPDKTVLKQVLSLLQKDNISAMYLLFQSTWLGGDKEIMEDSELFLSAISTISELFKKYDATVEKIDGNFKFTIDNKSCIIRKPKIAELSKLFSLLEKDPLSASESLLETCWLSGDEEIKTNDDYFLSLSPMLEQVLNIRSATLKKN